MCHASKCSKEQGLLLLCDSIDDDRWLLRRDAHELNNFLVHARVKIIRCPSFAGARDTQFRDSSVVFAFDLNVLSEIFSQAVHEAFGCVVVTLLIACVAFGNHELVAVFHALNGQWT